MAFSVTVIKSCSLATVPLVLSRESHAWVFVIEYVAVPPPEFPTYKLAMLLDEPALPDLEMEEGNEVRVGCAFTVRVTGMVLMPPLPPSIVMVAV